MKLPRIIAVERKVQLTATKCTVTHYCYQVPFKCNSVK